MYRLTGRSGAPPRQLELKRVQAWDDAWSLFLHQVCSKSFMDRGADIGWCSAFPAEREYLYPPLTYLQPTRRREVVTVGSVEIEVVEVEPRFGS